MNATPIESVVARCLMEPEHLERLRASAANPFALAELERLRLFGGFISKVHHNDLWDDFSATRRWLHRAGKEILYFADYRASYVKPGPQKYSQAEKVQRFISYLQERLAKEKAPQMAGLSEALRHESILWEMSERGPRSASKLGQARSGAQWVKLTVDELSKCCWKNFGCLVPRFRGEFRVAAFARDPLPLVVALQDDQALPSDNPKKQDEAILAYWKPPGETKSSVWRLEGYEASVLAAINGRRTVDRVIAQSRAAGLGAIAPRHFREFFLSVVGAKVIDLSRRSNEI